MPTEDSSWSILRESKSGLGDFPADGFVYG